MINITTTELTTGHAYSTKRKQAIKHKTRVKILFIIETKTKQWTR